MTTNMIEKKTVADVDVVMAAALELVDANEMAKAYEKYLEAGMLFAEQGDAEQLQETLAMVVACTEVIEDISLQDVEISVKEIINTWPGVISWEDVQAELFELTAGEREFEARTDPSGMVDDMDEKQVEQIVERVGKQTKTILQNADGATEENVQKVDDATEQLESLSAGIEKVVEGEYYTPKHLKTIRQTQEDLDLSIFDLARRFKIHFTGAQMRAINGNSWNEVLGMVDFGSLQGALDNDPVLASDNVLPGRNRTFRASLFGKIIRLFQVSVKHWSAVDDLPRMNITIDLWKVWHKAYYFDGNIAQKILIAISNPEKYDFDAAQKKQKKLKTVAVKRNLKRNFGGDVDDSSKK